MSNDSSDSDDESQEPKGKGIFSGRGPLEKNMNVVSDCLTECYRIVAFSSQRKSMLYV